MATPLQRANTFLPATQANCMGSSANNEKSPKLLRPLAIYGLLPGLPGIFAITLVLDNGPGIPEHQQAAVFKEFEQLNQQSREPGRGLALAQVRWSISCLAGQPVVAKMATNCA